MICNLKNKIIERYVFFKTISTMDFNEAFSEFLKLCDISGEEIALELHTSEKSIERYCKGDTKPDKPFLTTILVAFSPSYSLSEAIIKKAGYDLSENTKENIAYRYFLEQEGTLTIEKCNKIIHEINKGINEKANKIALLNKEK